MRRASDSCAEAGLIGEELPERGRDHRRIATEAGIPSGAVTESEEGNATCLWLSPGKGIHRGPKIRRAGFAVEQKHLGSDGRVGVEAIPRLVDQREVVAQGGR